MTPTNFKKLFFIALSFLAYQATVLAQRPVDLKNPEFAKLHFTLTQESETKLFKEGVPQISTNKIEMKLVLNPQGVLRPGDIIMEVICDKLSLWQVNGAKNLYFDSEKTTAPAIHNEIFDPFVGRKMELVISRYGEVKSFRGADEAFKSKVDSVKNDPLRLMALHQMGDQAMTEAFRQIFSYLSHKKMQEGNIWDKKVTGFQNTGLVRKYVFQLEKKEKTNSKIKMTAEVNSTKTQPAEIGDQKIKPKWTGTETGWLELDPYGWIINCELKGELLAEPQKKGENPISMRNTLRFTRTQP